MTKQEFIKYIAESEDIPLENAGAIVDEFLRLIEDRMKRGEETQIYGFGKFGVRWWKGRPGRDPQTGEKIELKGRWIPYWSPSPSLVEETEDHQAAQRAGEEEAAGEEKPGETKPEESPEETEKEVKEEEESEKEIEEEIESALPGTSVEELSGEEPSEEKSIVEEQIREDPASEKELPGGAEKEEQAEKEAMPEMTDESTTPEINLTEERSEEEGIQPEENFEEEKPPDPDRQIPEEEYQEEEDEEEFHEPDLPNFLFRETEEEPGADFSGEESRGTSEFLGQEELPEEDEPEFPRGRNLDRDYDYEEPAGESERQQTRFKDEAKFTRQEDPSTPEDMPWLYPDKSKRRGWKKVLLVFFFLLVAGGALYYTFGNAPFLTRLLQQAQDNFLQESPGNIQDQESVPVSPPLESEATQEEEQLGGLPEETSTQEAESPVAESGDTAAEDIRPYQFTSPVRENFLETYQEALNIYEDGNYVQAMRMFRRLLISDPPVDYADNTQYWIGECEFGLQHYGRALEEFKKVLRYPNTTKTDDALIMMASSYIHLNDYNSAREILDRLQSQYPNSQYVYLARKWMREYNL